MCRLKKTFDFCHLFVTLSIIQVIQSLNFCTGHSTCYPRCKTLIHANPGKRKKHIIRYGVWEPWSMMSEYKLPLLNEEGFFMVHYHKQGCSVSDFLNRVMLVNTSPDMGDKPPNFQKPDSLHLPCIISLHVYIKPVLHGCTSHVEHNCPAHRYMCAISRSICSCWS